MNTEKIEQLLKKYYDGESSLEEEELLRSFFERENIPDHLKSYREQFTYASELGQKKASSQFDPFGKISFESNSETVTEVTPLQQPGGKVSDKILWSLRIAAGLVLLLTGFAAGLLVERQGASDQQVAALQQEIQQMKTALVYGTTQPVTASERISAVKLSERVPQNSTSLDGEITEILIYTLNNDQNINVREAAAEALFRFRNEPRIRKALVNSLNKQDDPLMQLTLINMLVELKEKSAINQMQKLFMDSDTREVVKTRLEVSIAELKT